MTRYILRRLALALATLAGILLLVFALLHLAPGDIVTGAEGAAGRSLTRGAASALRRTYGLDRPLASQLGAWLGRAWRFDFGDSFVDHRPVTVRIREALPFTLGLNALALALILGISVPLGVAQARRAGSLFDRGTNALLFLLFSMPSFWVAMLLVTLFSVHLRWLPLFGVAGDLSPGASLAARLADRAAHLALPLVCLTYGGLAFVTRMVRSTMRETLGREFVLAARARGVSERRVIWAHAFRNALLPLVTLAGFLVPALFSGSVIVEQIFAWPGLGRLFFASVLARDYPVVLGLCTLSAAVTLASMLAADLVYAAADPRVRYD